MWQKKGFFLIILLVIVGILLADFGVPGKTTIKFFNSASASAAALSRHASNGLLVSTIPVTKANSLTPIEQDEPNCENNLAPHAFAGENTVAVFEPGKNFAIVYFNGDDSYDTDGTIEDYLWQIGNNGVFSGVFSTEEHTSFKFWRSEVYDVRLTVTDNCGATNQNTAKVIILEHIYYPPFNTSCSAAEIELYSENYELYDFEHEFDRLALAACGSAAIPALIAIVEDENSKFQCQAALALAEMGEEAEAAIPALTTLFWISAPLDGRSIGNDECEFPEYYLAAVGGKAVVPVFIEALQDENLSVRYPAMSGLEFIGEDAQDAVPALIKALNQEGSNNFKDAVAKTLGDIGTDADLIVPALIKWYEEEGSGTAISVMAKFGPEAKNAIPQIEQAFMDPETRDTARRTLESIGRAAVPSLVMFLNDSDPEVRASAAYALMLMGEDAEAAVDDLKNAIEDQDQRVYTFAAITLAQIDPVYAQFAAPWLISVLEAPVGDYDQKEVVQTRVALLLGQMGSDAIDAVPTLLKIVDTSYGDVRSASIIALGNIADTTQDEKVKEAVPLLLEILGQEPRRPIERFGVEFHPPVERRLEAALALGKIGQRDTSIEDALIKASGDFDEEVRRNALIALGMLGFGFYDLMYELDEDLSDENVDVQRRAALSLATIGPYAVPYLLTVLDDDDNVTGQIGAAYALGNLEFSNREIIEALQGIVEDEDNELELRRVAASSLQSLGIDMHQFFESYKLVNPQDAVAACPVIPHGLGGYGWIVKSKNSHDVYEYDVLTGECLYVFAGGGTAQGGMMIDSLYQFFGRVGYSWGQR